MTAAMTTLAEHTHDLAAAEPRQSTVRRALLCIAVAAASTSSPASARAALADVGIPAVRQRAGERLGQLLDGHHEPQQAGGQHHG